MWRVFAKLSKSVAQKFVWAPSSDGVTDEHARFRIGGLRFGPSPQAENINTSQWPKLIRPTFLRFAIP